MKWQALVLVVLLLFSGIRLPIYAQKPVVITIGHPNIWSLEQAHYLLSRMRAQNLQLSNKAPGQDDLDPNAANGIRIQTLKMLLDISTALDTPLGSTNRLIGSDQRFNQRRRQDLLTRMDTLYSDLDRVTAELAVLKVERERMNKENADEGTKKLKDAEIDAATVRQETTRERLKASSDELKGLTSSEGKLAGPELEKNDSRLPEAIIDTILKNKDSFRGDARLSASTMLDNHIQLQYEMIAKQLTLLRDEVAPGERLVFLELPASFYTTPGRAEEKIAQVWWHIDGYRIVDEYQKGRIELNQLLNETYLLYLNGRMTWLQWIRARTKINLAMKELEDKQLAKNAQNRQRIMQGVAQSMPFPFPILPGPPPPPPAGAPTPRPFAYYVGSPGEIFVPLDAMHQNWRHSVRTIDLIPRQSSLNVNDIQDTVKAGRLSAAFSFLFGFGAKVDFQRQRELYEQYLHQEIFASGFGKGERTFGWTFGPTPGTKRIAPGLRTSYAVLVVPESATMLRLTAKGCYFPRKEYSPDDFRQVESTEWLNGGLEQRCTGDNRQVFDVPIPSTRDNNFWLTEIRYKQVAPNQSTVVFLHGDNISAQTGVLVNGTPLRSAVGVAQPELNGAKLHEELLDAGDDVVSGYYELINRTQMALVFKMPKDFKGTPIITLVSPGRGRIINHIPLRINSGTGFQKLENAPPMFAEGGPEPTLSISDLEIITIQPLVGGGGHRITANLSGILFDTSDNITVNGRAVVAANLLAASLYSLTFDLRAEDQTLNVIVRRADKLARKSFAKPVTLRVDKFDILNFTPPGSRNRGSLTIHLKGIGFESSLVVSINGVAVPAGQFTVISPTEAVLVVNAPPETMLLTLQNSATGGSTSVLIVRPNIPEERTGTERRPRP